MTVTPNPNDLPAVLEQLQQAEQPCDRIANPEQCSGDASGGSDGSSSDSGSGISALLRKPLYLALLICGLVLLLLVVGVGIFFLQRHCRSRAKADLARLHADGGLVANPARPSQWSKATQWSNI